MKKGINAWAFPGNWKIEEILKLAKEVDFDGVELNLSETGYLTESSKDKEVLEIKKLTDDLGLEVPSISSGLNWKYSLSSKDKKLRKRGIEIVKKMVHIAKLLNADTVLVVPGVVNEEVFYDEAVELSYQSLLEVKPLAEKGKIIIGIENVWNKLLLSPLEMNNFIKRFNSKYFGAYLDVGNILIFGYPQHWIKILNNKIAKIHIKDFITSKKEFTYILQGDVNWKEVISELKRIKYNNYIIAEISPYNTYPQKAIIDTSTSMDYLLKNFL